MVLSPMDLDPTVMTIAKACVGALLTIAVALGSLLIVRIVKWVRWWITQEQKFARLAAFELEVMGDSSTGKTGLRDRVISAEDAAAKSSKDVAALYALMGLTPGAMQAVQAMALREAIRRHVLGVGGAVEPDNGDVFSGVREHFANPDDTGRGARARVHAVMPSPLPPPAPRTRTPAMTQVVNHPVWDSRWGGKPPDDDGGEGQDSG